MEKAISKIKKEMEKAARDLDFMEAARLRDQYVCPSEEINGIEKLRWSMDKKLFLLDAMALIFRAYYALIRAPRISSKGKNTNAQFGFTNTLVELINNQKPSHMAVCFDTEAPTDRHIDFTDYKANRQEAPEDLIIAIPDIKKIVTGIQYSHHGTRWL